MTVRELKSQLNNLDENTTVAIKTPTGRSEITKAAHSGDYFTLWADNS